MDVRKFKGWSVRKIAEKIGINQHTLQDRLDNGMSLKEACCKPVRARRNPKIIKINKKVYSNIAECSRSYNKDPGTVRYRLDRGWTLEEALEIVKKQPKVKRNGKIYEIYNSQNNKKYIGITTRSLEIRFKAHKCDAFKGSNTKFHKALRKIGVSKFKIRLLKETTDVYELARLEVKYIKKYDTINKGYNDHAGGNGLGDRIGKSIEHDGVVFISYKALADYLGISSRTLEYRIKHKLPLEGSSKKYSFTYKGKTYKSKKALAKDLSMSETALHRRLKDGRINIERVENG